MALPLVKPDLTVKTVTSALWEGVKPVTVNGNMLPDGELKATLAPARLTVAFQLLLPLS